MTVKVALTVKMVNANLVRIKAADKQRVRNAPEHLKLAILENAERIPEKRFCPYIFEKGRRQGQPCGKGHFQGPENDACSKHRVILKQQQDRLLLDDKCTAILRRGPLAGQRCPRYANHGDSRCCRHRLTGISKRKYLSSLAPAGPSAHAPAHLGM